MDFFQECVKHYNLIKKADDFILSTRWESEDYPTSEELLETVEAVMNAAISKLKALYQALSDFCSHTKISSEEIFKLIGYYDKTKKFFTNTGINDKNAVNLMFHHKLASAINRIAGIKSVWLLNQAFFRRFYFFNLFNLSFNAAISMNYPQTAVSRHSNSHFIFGNSIYIGADNRKKRAGRQPLPILPPKLN